jgi:hypothetical protein
MIGKMKLRQKSVHNTFIYFLCISFLLLTCCFSKRMVEAKDMVFPIGGMVSRGEVKFEIKENLWKDVEPTHFPIFRGGKIKTEKGVGIITLVNNCQIELGQNSVLSFDRNDRLDLSQGKVDFRIPSEAEVAFKAGKIYVTKTLSLQAAGAPASIFTRGETTGSISLNSDGSVTVKSIRGSLFVLNQDRVVLASLSSKESITIPSIVDSGKERRKVAQVGEIVEQKWRVVKDGELLGLSPEAWLALGVGAGGITGLISYAAEQTATKDREQIPICQ